MPGLPRRPLTPQQKVQAKSQIKRAANTVFGVAKTAAKLPAGIIRKAFTNDNVYDVFPGMRNKRK